MIVACGIAAGQVEFEVALEEVLEDRSLDASLSNRPFARWRHFTTTTRILFVFPFTFKFGSPSEVYITKALICTRKQKPEGFWP